MLRSRTTLSKSLSGRPDFKQMRSGIYRHMLHTRGWKYRSFLRFLRFFKYISFTPTRGSFLEFYYVLMRYLDDVVDGDVSIPEGYKEPKDYLEDKILFSRTLSNPRDPVDFLMLHCFELANKFGEEFHEETEDILNSLLFDARRRGSWKVFSKVELQEHFHRMDIRGTIRATLKVFREDPSKYPILEPLGIASRYQYDIEDVETDLAVGYVNISREEMDELGIREEELKDPTSAGIQRWLFKHATEGLQFLKDHKEQLPQGRFSLLARATFPLVYVRPAHKVFQEVLKRKDNPLVPQQP